MPCYHPVEAWKLSDGTVVFRHPYFIPGLQKYFRPEARKDGFSYTEIKLPCGKCQGCSLDYAKDWAIRCALEAEDHLFNWFATLTYSNAHLKFMEVLDTYTGELVPTTVLHKSHISEFMKRLRRHYEYHFNHKGIRFFGCGEYGDITQRPHYHILLFNLPINDLELHKKTKNGAIWNSETITNIWGMGHVAICEMNYATAAYTARYCLKKRKNLQYNRENNIPIEFTIMSRDPGIGYFYLEKNLDKIYKNDEVIITKKNGAQAFKPPRYFDKKLRVTDEEKYNEIKEKRVELMKEALKLKLENTSLSEKELLQIEENKRLISIAKLVRTFE